MALTRRDVKLFRVYEIGTPVSEWEWVSGDVNRVPAKALAIARRLVAAGRPDARIHSENAERIMTATAAQWVQAAAEVSFD
jgi:hypothetical protein